MKKKSLQRTIGKETEKCNKYAVTLKQKKAIKSYFKIIKDTIKKIDEKVAKKVVH